MPNFQYKALDQRGNQTKGTIDAESVEMARQILRNQGLTPVEVKAETLLTKDWSFDKAPSRKDLSMFCKQFASLMRAGVNITDTLEMLSSTVSNKLLQKAIKGTKTAVQKGETLADSMKQYPQCFDSMMINMVEAGEASGSLDESFERVALQIDKSDKIASAIKGALIYPIIVLIVAVIVIIVLLVLVVPSFMNMFSDMDMEMPKITTAVVKLSDFVKGNIFLLLVIIAGLIVGFKLFKKSSFGSNFLATAAIKLPAIGNFTIKSQSSKFARTLSSMQAAGITLNKALDISAGVVTNLKFKEATIKARDLVMTGVPLAQALQEQDVFPTMLTHMVAIGEDTGDLPGMLEKTADYYDEQTQAATDALMAVMSPATIILLLVVVGPILAAVLAPMLTLYTGLGDNI